MQQGEYSRIRCHEIFFAVMQFARSRRSSHICPLKRQLFSQDRCITPVTRRTLLFNVMALRIAGVHPSCECTLSANCYCSTRSHVCFFSEKRRFIQTIQISSRILFDNLCLSAISFIINTYIYIHNIKKKSIKET